MAKYYAVAKGFQTGIFTDAKAYKAAVSGFSGPMSKGFTSREQAERYLKMYENKEAAKIKQEENNKNLQEITKYYVVLTKGNERILDGKKEWKKVTKKGKEKHAVIFKSREEAEEFLNFVKENFSNVEKGAYNPSNINLSYKKYREEIKGESDILNNIDEEEFLTEDKPFVVVFNDKRYISVVETDYQIDKIAEQFCIDFKQEFDSLEIAKKFADMAMKVQPNLFFLDIPKEKQPVLHLYVDGSFRPKDGSYSYAYLGMQNEEKVFEGCNRIFSGKWMRYRNVAGEIAAAREGIRIAIQEGYRDIIVYHDFNGTGSWPEGNFGISNYNRLAEQYVSDIMKFRKYAKISFVKVEGHSGVEHNEYVDSLASQAEKEVISIHPAENKEEKES